METQKLTGKEIIEKLKELEIELEDFAYDEVDIDPLKELGLEFEEVDQYGGEGQGDNWFSVKYFPNHDVYLNINGWYSSYNGTEFDGWDSVTEVRPVQKTVTVYE